MTSIDDDDHHHHNHYSCCCCWYYDVCRCLSVAGGTVRSTSSSSSLSSSSSSVCWLFSVWPSTVGELCKCLWSCIPCYDVRKIFLCGHFDVRWIICACCPEKYLTPDFTRSQAVAKTAPLGSRDHLILMSFLICGPLERSLYLQPFSRYCALSILASRVCPFRVVWRHRSCDHLIANRPFPIGGPLEPSLYL